jgi:hypothetical protein
MKRVFERFLNEEQTYDDEFLWDDLLLWDGGVELPPDPSKQQPQGRFRVFGGSGAKRREIKLDLSVETNLLTLNQQRIEKHQSAPKTMKLKGSLQIPKIQTIAHGVSDKPKVMVEVEDFYYTSQQMSDDALIGSCILENNTYQNKQVLPIVKSNFLTLISEKRTNL